MSGKTIYSFAFIAQKKDPRRAAAGYPQSYIYAIVDVIHRLLHRWRAYISASEHSRPSDCLRSFSKEDVLEISLLLSVHGGDLRSSAALDGSRCFCNVVSLKVLSVSVYDTLLLRRLCRSVHGSSEIQTSILSATFRQEMLDTNIEP